MTRKITFDNADGSIVVDVPSRELQSFQDSDAMSFFIAQTTGLDPIVYEKKYPNIRYREDVPVDTSYPEGVQSITYRAWDADDLLRSTTVPGEIVKLKLTIGA